MDSVSEVRLQEVAPQLSDLVHRMADILAEEGITFRVVQGYRTWAEQAALYAQGRTAPGKIVTNAEPGHGWHEFGCAVDLAPFAGTQIDWNVSHPCWKRMIQVGESVGLFSGSQFRSFPDNPHFQLTGRFPVSPTDEVREFFKNGGTKAVWDAAFTV